MGKYHLTNKAVDDLTAIWNYTFDQWSEHQADKYYQLIIDSCREIAEKPDIGKIYEGVTPNLLGLRTNKHIIFYRIISLDGVEITRILHERMDLKKKILE